MLVIEFTAVSGRYVDVPFRRVYKSYKVFIVFISLRCDWYFENVILNIKYKGLRGIMAMSQTKIAAFSCNVLCLFREIP